MKKELKHMGNNGFPHGNNIDVYKYDNELDYSRYDNRQMTITVCAVSWDIGEAHIGNRSISGVGNVVHFGTKDKRDSYFANLKNAYRFETKYKELHKDLKIVLPIPFDIISNYNYIWVEYDLFANNDSLLEFENEEGVNKWGYFIRNAKMKAPNTTEVELLEDIWQTFIYDFEIGNMILERGHAPLFDTTVEKYLQNPLDNSINLTTEDVSFGELQKLTTTKTVVLNNENMKAVIVSNADFNLDWTNQIPVNSYNELDGATSYNLYAVDVSKLEDFFSYLEKSLTQFIETIKCIFFIDSSLIELGKTQILSGVSISEVKRTKSSIKHLMNLTKDDFGYDNKYANIAKLYTYPYSAIELTDENGNTNLIKIEETNNNLKLNITANLIYPYLNLQSVISGIGGNNEINISFKNITEHSFKGAGRWYNYINNWNIATFGVLLQHSKYYDYSTKYDREQMKNNATTTRDVANRNAKYNKQIQYRDAENTAVISKTQNTNTYNIAIRDANTILTNENAGATTNQTIANKNATTTKANADNSATTANANEGRNAQLTIDNANAQISANNTITTKGNEASISDVNLSNSLITALNNWDNGYTLDTTNADNDSKIQSAAVSAAGSVVSGAAQGAIAGAAAGPVGAGIGALTGLVSGGISAAVTGASTAIATNLATTMANLVVANNTSKANSTRNNNSERTTTANNAKLGQTTATNTMITTSAINSSSTAKSNANANYSTATTNNSNTYNASVANATSTYNLTTANATRTNETAKSDATDTRDTNIKCYDNQEITSKNDADDRYSNATENATDVYNNDLKKIENLINQNKLVKPLEIGNIANAENATTKPIALFANVITQSKSNIALAGDEMLRYGYMLNRNYDFDGNWTKGKYFCYWKLKDYWIKNNQLSDYYQDAIRFFLMGGVTIWSDPTKIGKVTIYENLE